MKENLNSQLQKALRFAALPLAVVLASAGIWFAVGSLPGRHAVSPEEELVQRSPFDNISITAKAAYVYDARTKEVLYAKNEDLRLPLASVTKVMTALVAKESGSAEGTVVIGESALAATGDSGLYGGERWRLKDILDFSLTSSSNDGMKAVAASIGALSGENATPEDSEEAFVQEMNKKAEALDMKNTYFFNPTGLDESEVQGGAYGTVKDITLLFDYVLRYHPSLMEATKEEEVAVASLDNHMHIAENTDLKVTDIPGIKASKTGYTDIAGGNLVVAFDPELGRPIIVAVLGSTASGRFEDVETLIKASMREISQEK
jgi:D-alanyl-D-alanine carboxypeptidase (penicillin-binding protein 5/6)